MSLQTHRLRELALVFLRLGAVAIGGPPAQIAMIRDEVVWRRGWMTEEQFLDRLGAANLIPGPNTAEITIFSGYLRAGWPGLIVAGVCFTLPAACLVAGIAWSYVRFGNLPQVSGILYGLKPAVIALVLQAIWKLGRTAGRTPFLAILGLLALIATLAGASPLSVIAGAGSVAGFFEWWRGPRRRTTAALFFAIAAAIAVSYLLPFASPPRVQTGAVGLRGLFFYFLRTGSVIFGGGSVLVAFLQKDLVANLHWVTSKQLLDAVAVGWATPGPAFTTATFIGYVLLGWPGAVAATVGIFLPSFFACAFSGPLIPKLRDSKVAGAFLDGVNAASVALMASVSWDLARAGLTDPLSIGLALSCGAILLRFAINPAWLVLASGLIGLVSRSG